MTNIIGYGRVSTSDQDTTTQEARLRQAGCNIIRAEKVSGATRDGRTELASVLEFMQAGDALVVVKLDRLGRSTRDVLNIVHELEQKGASLRVLEPAIDTSGPMGKLVLTVLGMVAEMELSFIKDRQKAGIAKAKLEAKYKGRKITLDHSMVVSMYAGGKGATEIANKLKCSRGAVYKILKQSVSH